MGSYPMMLNMTNKLVVVVGGGQIAYRKTLSLLEAGARVTVISPVINEKFVALLAESQIGWKNKVFEPEDLQSAILVIAATNSQKVNRFVALSTGSHQLVNVVDQKELSDFHVPAKLERGDLTIAVSTGGASPMLAKVIRDELAAMYDESYIDYLNFLAISRKKVKQLNLNQQHKIQLLKEITTGVYRQSVDVQKTFLEMIDSIENQEG